MRLGAARTKPGQVEFRWNGDRRLMAGSRRSHSPDLFESRASGGSAELATERLLCCESRGLRVKGAPPQLGPPASSKLSLRGRSTSIFKCREGPWKFNVASA